MKNLPVPIPLDLADDLKVSRSYLSHINACRKRLSVLMALEVMELALVDDRLTGLHFLHLRPDLKSTREWICQPMARKARCD
jgi:hypothetical protein